MSEGFVDRLEAGRRLALRLEDYRDSEAILLGLARGGIVVGYAAAEELGLPLRALVVRKIGAPDNPELAIGAVSETGVRRLDRQIVEATHASAEYIRRVTEEQVVEARRRQQEYASGPGLQAVKGRPGIVVDDGIATGATAVVAVQSVRDLGASHVILATPVASLPAVRLLEPIVDRLVALMTPDPFFAVGLHYRRFEQVTDAEVVRYLRLANERLEAQP